MDADVRQALFIGTFPAGIVYADRRVKKGRDYKEVAFLSYATLVLSETVPGSDLLPAIREHAASIQAREGEAFQVSASGQTVLLGGN